MDNFSINDEGDYNDKVPSLKEIILLHIKRISSICCEEFIKGYWEEKPVKVGGGIAVMKKYHQDQRSVFCNAVDFLLWIVTPMGDNEFKEKYLEFENTNTDKESIDARLKESQKIFRDINIMFNRTKFFDTMSGQTE